MASPTERQLHIEPVVLENVQHNGATLSYVRNLTSSIFGACAGILGLTSLYGFLFYAICTTLVSGLIYITLARGTPARYYKNKMDIFTNDLFGPLPSFILCWTLAYALLSVYD
ncbi:hypothetical protein YB2330_001432 [Saitoella coloradoensis]